MANGLIRARDEEAKRIAHTLHDESGQLLALVYIALDELSAGLAEADKNQVREIKRLLDSVEDRWRDLSHELHPSMLDHLGLTPTTEYLTAQIAKRTGLQINLSDYLNRTFTSDARADVVSCRPRRPQQRDPPRARAHGRHSHHAARRLDSMRDSG